MKIKCYSAYSQEGFIKVSQPVLIPVFTLLLSTSFCNLSVMFNVLSTQVFLSFNVSKSYK